MDDGRNIAANAQQASISLLSCVWILLIVSVSALLFVIFLAWKYKTFRQSGSGDSWLTFLLVSGSFLCYSSIFPFAARVYFALQIQTRLNTEELIQLAIWFLSIGSSLIFGSQSVLAWRRWKIQNSHFYIRVEYLASILTLIILVDISQLTLWHTTDPFRCSMVSSDRHITCNVHYLPLWLLSNFLHKGVLILTTIVYSWRLQLLSTSRSILRSLSGCTLLSSSCVCVCISLLSPLVCISSNYLSLQHLSLTIAILLATTSTTILHFIPKILNSNADRRGQVVRVRNSRQSIHYPDTPSEQHHKNQLSIGERLSLFEGHRQSSRVGSVANLRAPMQKPVKASVRVGTPREMIMAARKHHKSCSHIGNNPLKIEPHSASQVSTPSTRTAIHEIPAYSFAIKKLEPQQTRIRKSFSLNDMKRFLSDHNPQNHLTLVDSRAPVPVLQTNGHLLRPLIEQPPFSGRPLLEKSNEIKRMMCLPQSITTSSISPTSSAKSLRNEEDGSLASKMWLTPSILRSNPINFIRLGSLQAGLSINEENSIII